MKLNFLKQPAFSTDSHKKPWGGLYALRLWRGICATSLALLAISIMIHYKIYEQYTHPIEAPVNALAKQMVVLDQDGLGQAVSLIKEKESKFNLYLMQKPEITDPAK